MLICWKQRNLWVKPKPKQPASGVSLWLCPLLLFCALLLRINHFLNTFSLSLLNEFLSHDHVDHTPTMKIMLITQIMLIMLIMLSMLTIVAMLQCCIGRLFALLLLLINHFLNSFFLSSWRESLSDPFVSKSERILKWLSPALARHSTVSLSLSTVSLFPLLS